MNNLAFCVCVQEHCTFVSAEQESQYKNENKQRSHLAVSSKAFTECTKKCAHR